MISPIQRMIAFLFLSMHMAKGQITYTGETKVGILHSLTGTMAISEQTVVNADLMAIDEINAAGGLLGQKIVPIIEDGESDWDVFAQKAEQFANPQSSKHVVAVFGCWTSASRKKVLPVFEKHNHMLFYPVQYEGQECSKNIFYTGAAPNQQIEPAVEWLLRTKGKQFFLVGSDYVFPRTANEIIKGQLEALGGETVGEDYLPLGESRNITVGAIVDRIKTALPNGGVIFNTLNGDSNVKFFHMLYDAGLRADKYPSMSVSITETEISVIGVKYLVGHYAAWNFFMSIKDNPSCPGGFDPSMAQKFVQRYQAKYGATELVNDPMESAYISVYLWAQAVQLAGTFDIEAVRAAVKRQAYAAPEGEVAMQVNHHISKFVRIGQVVDSGDFVMVYESTRAVRPEPWNAWVQSSTGHACDWTDPVNKGRMYKVDEVPVALVHPLSGPNEALERQFLEAEMAAIKSINREGGVRGKMIKPVFFTAPASATDIQRSLSDIIAAKKDAAIFSAAASAAAYKTAVTQHVDPTVPLLFNPRRSFGDGDCSEHVIRTGVLLNQQLLPSLKYFSDRARGGGASFLRFFFVLPASMPAAIASEAFKRSVETTGDRFAGYETMASASDAAGVVSAIRASMVDGGTIVNLLDDMSLAIALANEMRTQNVPAGAFPVLYTGVTASDISRFGDFLSNQYVALPYVMALEMSQNTIFLDVMREFYGTDYTVTDNSEAAYVAVRMWADAVRAADSFSSKRVLHSMWENSYRAPAGEVRLQGSNFISKQSRIATLNAQGTGFRIIAGNSASFMPEPEWLTSRSAGDRAVCDFIISLRTVCVNGKGLVSANGSFLSSRDGAVNCDWCQPGSFSAPLEGSGDDGGIETRICKPCDIGTMQDAPGQDSCKKCQPGHYGDGLARISCTMCDVGSYQDKEGMSTCQSCLPNQVTVIMGSTNASQCLCDRDYYRNCPTCPCLPCQLGMTCGVGSDMSNYWEWHEAGRGKKTGGFPELASSYMSLPEEPLSVYRCKSEIRCPGGPPGKCGENFRSGTRSCAHCELGYYMSGDACYKCNAVESSPAFYPVLPFLCGFVIVCILYRISRDSLARWGSWRNGLATMGFLLLNHYQITASCTKLKVAIPEALAQLLESFKFIDDTISIFRPQCTGYASFQAAILVRALGPLLVLGVFVATFLASRVVERLSEKPVGFNKDMTMNIFFSVMFTFFAAIASMSLDLFKCFGNPNGLSTLSQDQSVICYESEWLSMVVVAVISCLVNIFGFGSFCAYIVYVAPNRFHDVSFQRRYKFLFLKFRTDVDWWALVICAKGLALSVVFTFFAQSIFQIVFSEMVILAYGGASLFFTPWRHRCASALDLYTHASLLMLLSVLLFHLSPMEFTQGSAVIVVTVVVIIVNLSPLLLFFYLSYRLKTATLDKNIESILALLPSLRLFSNADTATLNAFVGSIDDWNRFHILNGLQAIHHDYMGKRSAAVRRLHTWSFHKEDKKESVYSQQSEPKELPQSTWGQKEVAIGSYDDVDFTDGLEETTSKFVLADRKPFDPKHT